MLPAGTLVELLPVGVVALDELGRVLAVNRAACELLGLGEAPALGESLERHLPPISRLLVESAIHEAVAGEEGSRTLVEGAGGPVELDVVMRATDRAPVVVIAIHDASHRHDRELELEHRATHDALTGLPNRAWMLDHVHARLQSGHELVVAFVDLDRFKTVNDELGHEAGDAVLSDVANSLGRCLHPGESAARVGGDEFVVISSGLDDDALADFDQRIRLAVATVPAARRHRVGVSVGVVRSTGTDEPWSLLRRADAAMYEQKRRPDRRVQPAGRRGADVLDPRSAGQEPHGMRPAPADAAG